MSDARRGGLKDWRYVPGLACVLLVVLRLSIGWQFLYEGLWKYDTLDTPAPWTAEGYLEVSKGPFRGFFRGWMAEDPNDFRWLNPKWVAARWDRWAERFTQHYNLNEDQKRRINVLLNGEKQFRAVLAELPEGVSIPENMRDTVWFDPAQKRLIVSGSRHLSPKERDRLLSLVESPASEGEPSDAQKKAIQAYREAVTKVFLRSSRLSYKEQMRVLLGPYDPERVRIVFANFEGTIGNHAPDEIGKYYRELIENYESNLDQAQQTGLAYQHEHLTKEWQELQKLRVALVGPIQALDHDLREDARTWLTTDQIAKGPIPAVWTWQHSIDMATIAGLTILGLLLICGLATRPAAFCGAVLVLSFYLVWPPWPGVPEIPGSTQHSYIVNKNFIEILALLSLAALPTGQWFGLDRLIRLGWRRLRSKGSDDHARETSDGRKTVAAGT